MGNSLEQGLRRMSEFREATKHIRQEYLLFCKTTELTHVEVWGYRIKIESLSFMDWCRWTRANEVAAALSNQLPELQSSDLTFSEAFTDYEEVAA